MTNADTVRPDAPAAVDARSLSLSYTDAEGRPLLAVDETDLRIEAGQFVALVGASGCGKTSLLRLIAGLVPATRGEVRLFGRTPDQARSRKQIGLVFQEPALLPWRSVEANIALGRELNPNRDAEPAVSIDELVQMVGLDDFRRFRPAALSGGMQQRVALARALALDPPLLLLDEPFAALDEITREEMRYELLRLWALSPGDSGHRRSALFVTHSVHEAVAVADRVLVMSPRPGRIVADIPIDTPRPRRPDHEQSDAFRQTAADVRAALRGQHGRPDPTLSLPSPISAAASA